MKTTDLDDGLYSTMSMKCEQCLSAEVHNHLFCIQKIHSEMHQRSGTPLWEMYAAKL